MYYLTQRLRWKVSLFLCFMSLEWVFIDSSWVREVYFVEEVLGVFELLGVVYVLLSHLFKNMLLLLFKCYSYFD